MQVVNNGVNSIPASRSFTFADEDETDEMVVTPSKNRTGPVSPTLSDDNALSPSSLAYSLDSASPVKKLSTIPTNNNALLQTPPTASHSRVMLTPTKINISPSGMDDVHPLATMNTATTINKTPIIKGEVDDKHPSLFANTVQINKHKISPELSELTTTPTPKNTILPQANNSKLNMKQQVAMNNFLKAQTSGNPISKNEKWKELVYAMKESETNSPPTKQFNKTSSSSKSTTGSRYSKGSTTPVATKDYNAILGTLTINTPGGLKIGEQSTDGISLSSGLTSKSDSPPEDFHVEWGSINMWNPSPQPTPKKSGQFATSFSIGEGGTGNKQLTYRTVTPPNVPILSKADDNLPLVSPLSVDGSFDNEEENNGIMDTTGETTMSTPEELKLNIEDDDDDDRDGDKKKQKNKGQKKNAPCFFNLGESFADNTKRIWTADLGSDNDDVGSPDNIGSPVSDPSSGGGVERRTSSRTLSPLLLPSPRRSESPIVRGATFDTTKEVPSFSLGQPQVVVQQQKRSTASSSSSVASGSQLVCESIEGEVMSYQDMEEQSLAAAQKEEEITAVFGDFTTQDEVIASPPPADVLPEKEKKAATPSVVASAAILELSQSIPLTRSEPILNPPPTTTSSKRRTKTTTTRLEEQILSVIKQQPDSHVVDEEDEVKGDKGEATFGRSSPLPPLAAATPSTSTKPKKKKKKSGTVGSTASAQDILKELRSSTPHSHKYSGSLHSGGYSGTSLNIDSGLRGSTPHSLQSGSNNSSSKKKNETPPLGSISARLAALEARNDIKVGSAEQAEAKDQAVNVVTKSPSDEDELADKVGVKLPPSKRDVPRPYRISRRSASEPTPVETELKPAKSYGSISSSSKTRDTSEVYIQADTIHPPVQANPEPTTTSRISRLFPNTTPKPTTSGGTPPRQSMNPFDDEPSTNPFDSPPRRKVIADKSLEDPFDEQSSPIPVERSGVASEHSFNVDDSMDKSAPNPSTSDDSGKTQRIPAPPSSLPPRRDRRTPLTLSPSRRDTTPSPFRAKTSASPQTTKSSSSSEYIDELRATISQLKSVGVGGHGKPTSTLVRNEQTGRYIIRDISDDNFKVNLSHADVVNKEAVLPEEISTLGESYIGSIEENGKDESRNVDVSSQNEHQSFIEEKPRYNPLTQIIDEEIMDEAAVDAAVQAATMECMSTSSTTSHEASIESEEEEQQYTGGDAEEEDFFVVRKPTQQSEWSTFASFAKEDTKDDFDILPSHSWVDDKDDGFATGWDDSGFEETMWTPVAVQKKTIFSSPTSVATSKQTVTF